MLSTDTSPTRIALWAGWSIAVPPAEYQRNEDGSWSAWGRDWVVDISILETSGNARGEPFTAEHLLGEHPGTRISGQGWIGTTELLTEQDGARDVTRLAARLCAENTLMSCWISYERDDQQKFAQDLIGAITHGNGATLGRAREG